RLDPGRLDGLLDGDAIIPLQRQRLLDDEMFARLRGGHGVPGMILRIAANRNRVDARVREHGVELREGLDGRAVLRAGGGRIERAGGTNRGDLAVRRGIDGGNVRGRGPTVTDDADVIPFHARGAGLAEWQAFVRAKSKQNGLESRRPKPEIRKKPEIRCSSFGPPAFGLRISDFLRISNLGLRISLVTCTLQGTICPSGPSQFWF